MRINMHVSSPRQQSIPSEPVPIERNTVFQENEWYPSQFLLHEDRATFIIFIRPQIKEFSQVLIIYKHHKWFGHQTK